MPSDIEHQRLYVIGIGQVMELPEDQHADAAEKTDRGETRNGMWMRQDDYRAVSVAPSDGPGKRQLYNIIENPGETHKIGFTVSAASVVGAHRETILR